MMELGRLITVVLKGYALTIAVETPVLCVLLSPTHPMKRRIASGIWLTACSYPVVTVVLPCLFDADQYTGYVATAEIFAPLSECILFWFAYLRNNTAPLSEPSLSPRRDFWRDMLAIVVANALSFALGLLLMWLKIKL